MPVTRTPSTRRTQYEKYTIDFFANVESYNDFIDAIYDMYRNPELDRANQKFKEFVNQELRKPNNDRYGVFGKQPKNYDEAIARDKFVYWPEYKDIKNRLYKEIQKLLSLSSTADVMKPRMVFNDKQIGEFIYDRAAMALQPSIYFYSPSKKREIDMINEEVVYEGDLIYLKSDQSRIVRALKITLEDGSIEYMEIIDDDTLIQASKKGIVSVTSSNKKVYLYKEKKPKMYNSVKLVVGMTRGGFTQHVNDFYTGITAVLLLEILEELGYSVEIWLAGGGGRCGGCRKKLLFNGNYTSGRRWILIRLKDFNEQADIENMLYMLSDPSYHQVKFVQTLNSLFTLYRDQVDDSGDPAGTWHGIMDDDMVYPLGGYSKAYEYKRGNRQLLDFHIRGMKSESDVIQGVTSAVLSCENENLQALLKAKDNNDYGIT